jgi:hypothetical protein
MPALINGAPGLNNARPSDVLQSKFQEKSLKRVLLGSKKIADSFPLYQASWVLNVFVL